VAVGGRAGGGDEGSVGLLALLGGGVALLVVLVSVVVVADLVVTRARAQTAADAAALAAMAHPIGDGRGAARRLARTNGGRLSACCGHRDDRREVTVAVSPASRLLAAVVPRIEARAAAGLVAPPSVGGASVAGADGVAAVGRAVGGGGRVWPVAAPLTSGFGTRVHPITGAVRLHTGLDLGAPSGTPVAAAAAGVVAFAGPMGGYGNAIDVRHADGTTTRYAHLSAILVRAGQRVAAGQGIGLVGSTGLSTGPHLHFEVRTPAGPTDPRTWLP
jgi:murein DD-endopeptidase MepM/ murein hydrolase activator NlpD